MKNNFIWYYVFASNCLIEEIGNNNISSLKFIDLINLCICILQTNFNAGIIHVGSSY